MKNSSKLDFYLYEPLSFKMRGIIKKVCKLENFDYADQPWQSRWASWLLQGTLIQDNSGPIILQEYAWLKNPVCYLPDNSNLIRQLSETNFEGQINALHVAFPHFTIAMPKDVKFNNQSIKGVFVSYCTQANRRAISNDFYQDYGHYLGLKSQESEDPMLLIMYKDPLGLERIFNIVYVRNLKNILSATTIDEYIELCGRSSSEYVLSMDLNKNEARTQFLVLRFIVSFIVYLSVHPDAISEVKSLRFPGASKDMPKLRTLGVPQFNCSSGKRPHYRNVVHERFYRNEWSSWERGSRWIPVNMKIKKVEASD